MKVRYYAVKVEGELEEKIVRGTSRSAFKRFHGVRASIRRLSKREVREITKNDS
jgi:hypothetical protein